MQYPGKDTDRVRQTASIDEALRRLGAESARERAKWDVVRDEYLLRALQAKFTQHLDLEALLTRTEDAILVYKNCKDGYDGLGPDGTGHNMFGRLLMRVRQKIRIPPPPTGLDAKVIEHYEEIARKKPGDIRRLIKLAEVYLTHEMAEHASTAAYQALRLDPINIPVRVLLAQALMFRGLYVEAVEHLRYVNRNILPHEEVLRLLARAYRSMGRDIAAKVLESRAGRLGTRQDDSPEGKWSE